MPDPMLHGSIQRSPVRIQRLCHSCERDHPPQSVSALRAPLQVSRMCPECEKKHHGNDRKGEGEATFVQAQHAAGEAFEASSNLESYLAGSRGGGQPISDSVRSYFEPRFGHDFGAIRVHTDSLAARSASEIGARAYTVGQHIFFGAGQFATETSEGGRLLAHELVHTIQQGHRRDLGVQRSCGPAPIAAAVGARTGCTDRFDNTFVSGTLFRFNKDCDDFSTGQAAALRAFAGALPPVTTLEIHGFASVDGPANFNQDLGCARALEAQTLLTGAAPGGAGIASARITAVINHGPVAGPAADRRSVVIVTSSPPPPPPPVPPRPVPTGPLCGPDVTVPTQDVVALVIRDFGAWSTSQRESHCDALDSLSTGAVAWDIIELHNNGWILHYRPICATQGATPPCGSTVQVGRDCYYAGSPNYVIYGVMCKLCFDHYTATGNASGQARFTQGKMEYWINFYKGGSSPSANYGPSRDWAIAGYQGWPSGGTPPAGDRNTCSPACPTPYSDGPFTYNWSKHDR